MSDVLEKRYYFPEAFDIPRVYESAPTHMCEVYDLELNLGG